MVYGVLYYGSLRFCETRAILQTFAIRAFFREKRLLAHVWGGYQIPVKKCKHFFTGFDNLSIADLWKNKRCPGLILEIGEKVLTKYNVYDIIKTKKKANLLKDRDAKPWV